MRDFEMWAALSFVVIGSFVLGHFLFPRTVNKVYVTDHHLESPLTIEMSLDSMVAGSPIVKLKVLGDQIDGKQITRIWQPDEPIAFTRIRITP